MGKLHEKPTSSTKRDSELFIQLQCRSVIRNKWLYTYIPTKLQDKLKCKKYIILIIQGSVEKIKSEEFQNILSRNGLIKLSDRAVAELMIN